MIQAKLIIQAGLWPWPARVAANKHNAECHGGIPTANIEVDADYTPPPGRLSIPKYRVFCVECAELVADDETKGDDSE